MHGVLDWTIAARVCVLILTVRVCRLGTLLYLQSFCLLVMAAAAWMECLKAAGLNDPCAQALITAGYDDQAVFSEAFVDSAALERFIKQVLLTLKPLEGVTPDLWDIQPVAGKSERGGPRTRARHRTSGPQTWRLATDQCF